MFFDLFIQRHIAVGGAAEISVEHPLHLTEIIQGVLFRDPVPHCEAGQDAAVDPFIYRLKGL